MCVPHDLGFVVVRHFRALLLFFMVLLYTKGVTNMSQNTIFVDSIFLLTYIAKCVTMNFITIAFMREGDVYGG